MPSTPMRSSLRDQIAAKRAEARNSPVPRRAKGQGPVIEALEDRTVPGQISKAARNGKLDLNALSLPALPPTIYTDLLGIPAADLSVPPPKQAPPKREPVYDAFGRLQLDDVDEDDQHRVFGTPPPKPKWTEPEELTVLRAAENRIKDLEVEIGLFGGLKTLDLRGNELTSVPDALADLLRLTWLDLSNNSLTAIPPAALLLPELESLNLSNNAISAINLSSPVKPSDEGLSYGTGFLITAFERAAAAPKTVLPALRSLNLSHNSLTVPALSGLAGRGPLKIRILNLANNKLVGALNVDELGIADARLPELYSLVVSGNRGLKSIDGDLAPRAEVDSEGCGWGAEVQSGIGGTSPSPPRPTASSADADPDYVPTAGDGPSHVPYPSDTVTFSTLPAATFDSEPLRLEMDVYLPPPSASEATKPHPVVIWWHGGGLLQGNKENLPPHLRRLPSRTVNGEHAIAVSPNYRLSPQAPILDVLHDVDAAISFVRTKLNDRLAAKGHSARVDPNRIVLSGGSAGGYLALIAGLPVPKSATDADLGGYRGAAAQRDNAGWTPRGIAPFYPITDLEHVFWATKTDPVPWWGSSVPDSAARPHLNPRDAPVGTAVSGGPRSILYPYMLQHGLFPSLLFMNQRSLGHGLDGFRPNPHTLSITTRLEALAKMDTPRPPVYLAYGTKDDKVQPLEESVELLRATNGEIVVEVIPGADHAYDENPDEQAQGFATWLDGVLF